MFLKIAEALLWCIVALWAWACVRAVLNLLWLPRLTRVPASEPLPSLSVVIPARDEELDIEEAVTSHCVQDYPGLKVVVVDDGSTDGTPAILARLRTRFPNLTVIGCQGPPEGWLGKANAIQVGLESAAGELVLVADADVRYAPGTHRRAVREVTRGEADIVVLLQRLEARGLEPLAVSAFHAHALYAHASYLANVPEIRFVSFVAPGGMLLRREAFEAAGGMAAIRLKIPNDLAMARMMKTYRGRLRMVTAFDSVRHRMYRGLPGCVSGFTKNAYHFYGAKAHLAVPLQGLDLAVEGLPALLVPVACCIPALAPLRLPALIATAAGVGCNATACLWSRQPLWAALVFPLRAVVWTRILARSMWQFHSGGSAWRGRTYTGAG